MHEKCMQHKYTFLYKVFYCKIVTTHLLPDGFFSNLKRCYVYINMGDTVMSQRWPLRAEVLLPL